MDQPLRGVRSIGGLSELLQLPVIEENYMYRTLDGIASWRGAGQAGNKSDTIQEKSGDMCLLR
jgi:hypothetical protein